MLSKAFNLKKLKLVQVYIYADTASTIADMKKLEELELVDCDGDFIVQNECRDNLKSLLSKNLNVKQLKLVRMYLYATYSTIGNMKSLEELELVDCNGYTLFHNPYRNIPVIKIDGKVIDKGDPPVFKKRKDDDFELYW